MIKSQPCIEIPQSGNGYSSPKRFCNDCFQLVLEKTQEDLDALFDL